MIIQKTKYIASIFLAFVAGMVATLIFTRLLKWSVVLLLLGVTVGFGVWWIKRKLTKTKEVKT